MIDTVKRINELMDIKGWSAYELSNQTGISTNAIYDWNKIGAVPTLANIIKICDAMEISLEYFFATVVMRIRKKKTGYLIRDRH